MKINLSSFPEVLLSISKCFIEGINLVMYVLFAPNNSKDVNTVNCQVSTVNCQGIASNNKEYTKEN